MIKSKTDMSFCTGNHIEIVQTIFVKVIIVCMLFYSSMPFYNAQAVQLCRRWDSIDVLEGEYRINNNVWGADTLQCLLVYPDSTYFSVIYSEHDQSGVASYPFILKGCHWGNCTDNSGMPVSVNKVVTAPFSWSINTSGVSGTWNAAYESWFSTTGGTAPDAAELMIWINYSGGAGPGGSRVATVSIGGHEWYVYHASPWGSWDHYIAYQITSPTNNANLDFKDFIDDSVGRGYLEPQWYLDNMEAGFEIWVDGEGLTTNSFSGSIYDTDWLYGDITRDNMVDMNDLYEFCLIWLDMDCVNYAMLDLNGDCVINLYEYSLLAQNWLEEIE
jgi:hypothetical protein